MNFTTAQLLLFVICKDGNSFRDYRAPHAYRGTPAARRRRPSGTLTPRLFKGHRI